MNASKSNLVTEALRVHREALEAFVRQRVAAADIEDVLQLAAMRATQHAEDLLDVERVLPWLYRIHRNAVVDARRGVARRTRVVVQMETPPEPIFEPADEPCRCSLHLARSLPAAQQAILRWVDVEGESIPDAAERLAISTNNATVRLHRARKALREKLRRHCGVASASACQSCRCVSEGCCA